MSSHTSFHTGLGLSSLLLLLGACASSPPPEPATIENTEEVSAMVDAIDVSTRMVTLRAEDGETLTVQVSPDVQNLDQVKAGDRVVVRYYEALAAELRKRGGSGETEAPVVEAGAVRAPAGARPGAAVGTQVQQTVRIASVDKKNHIVSFFGADGLARSVPVRTPQGQEFAAKLKAGDEVELTYTEALAVSVEPSK